MFSLIKVNQYGVKYYRNVDTGIMYANSGEIWWKDFDGSGNFFQNVSAPESCRILSN